MRIRSQTFTPREPRGCRGIIGFRLEPRAQTSANYY